MKYLYWNLLPNFHSWYDVRLFHRISVFTRNLNKYLNKTLIRIGHLWCQLFLSQDRRLFLITARQWMNRALVQHKRLSYDIRICFKRQACVLMYRWFLDRTLGKTIDYLVTINNTASHIFWWQRTTLKNCTSVKIIQFFDLI